MTTTTIEQDVNKAIAEGHTYKSIMVGAIMNYDGLWDFSYADEIMQANKKDFSPTKGMPRGMGYAIIEGMVSDLLSEVMDDNNEWVEYPEDVASNWAGNMVDVYTHSLTTKLPFFYDATQEAMEQYGETKDLENILRSGQHFAYDSFAQEVLEYAKSLDNLIK